MGGKRREAANGENWKGDKIREEREKQANTRSEPGTNLKNKK